jgi:hypothetical protein
MIPSASARVVPGAPAAAEAEDHGVEISADGDDGEGRPVDLTRRLTPLKVRVVNHSGRPIELLYQRFSLKGARGHMYRPLPPIPLDHQKPIDAAGTVLPIYAASSFYVAQRYEDVYPSLAPWSRPLPETQISPRANTPAGRTTCRAATCSAWVCPRGSWSFTAALDDGDSDTTVAELAIPFRVE